MFRDTIGTPRCRPTTKVGCRGLATRLALPAMHSPAARRRKQQQTMRPGPGGQAFVALQRQIFSCSTPLRRGLRVRGGVPTIQLRERLKYHDAADTFNGQLRTCVPGTKEARDQGALQSRGASVGFSDPYLACDQPGCGRYKTVLKAAPVGGMDSGELRVPGG
jgi:hypothetical protein